MFMNTRYSINDVYQAQFYQLPKFLIDNENIKISSDAMILYSILRDRHSLSLKNKMVDKNGDVYIICTREEMGKKIGRSARTAIKLFAELKRINLVEEERRWNNKPNWIYLLKPEIQASDLPNESDEPDYTETQLSDNADDETGYNAHESIVHNARKSSEFIEKNAQNHCNNGTRKNFTSGDEKFSPPEVKKIHHRK